MTKAEWAIVEDKLRCMYDPVALMCDGYHVILRVEPHKELQNKIYVYVNGKLSFPRENNPELKRFAFPSIRKAHSAKQQKELRKVPKRVRKDWGAWADPDATFTTYLPWWGSFKALKSHLIKNNVEIELLKTWQYEPKKRTAA